MDKIKDETLKKLVKSSMEDHGVPETPGTEKGHSAEQL